MLPARTVCPAKRFTPRRLPILSRPLVVLPCPFLCAILSLLRDVLSAQRWGRLVLDTLLGRRLRLDALLGGINSCNLQRGQGLSMSLLATITFASPVLENNNFFAPLLRRNLGFDPHPSNGRRANRHLCTLSDKVHIGQCDCVANGTREFFYINRIAWTHSILPTTRRHTRIHILPFSLKSKCPLSFAVPSFGGAVSDQALPKLYKSGW